MKTLFRDRRSRGPLARRIFLSVWLIVAIIYLIGIAIVGAVFYVNMDVLMDSSFIMKLKLFLIGLGFIACVHGAFSLFYLYWKEIPYVIAAIDCADKQVKITTMNGHQTTHTRNQVCGVTEQFFGGIPWYAPYSLTIGKSKKFRILQVADGNKYLFSHDARLGELQRSLG